MNDPRPTIDQRTSLRYLVPLASIVGILWGLWSLHPYWTTLSCISLGWSLWATVSNLAITDVVWTLTAGSILGGTVLSQALSTENFDLWGTITVPIAIYLMSLGTIWSILGRERVYGPQTLVFLTSVTAVGWGCVMLLVMFFLGAALSAPPFSDNSTFMTYLIGILGGTTILAMIDRRVWLRRVAPRSAGALT